MKIAIKRVFLENMLQKASVISGAGGVSGVSSSFLIELKGEVLSVTRTDKMVSIVASTKMFDLLSPPDPGKPFSNRILVGTKFLTLVQNLDCEMIELDNADSSLSIVADTYTAKWLLEISDAFPPIPEVSQDNLMEIDTKEFLNCVDRVKYAATVESVTPAYKQIFFNNQECWAADDQRLQQVKTKLPINFSLILPVAVMDSLKFIKMENSSTFSFGKDKHFYIFKVGMDVCICRIPGIPIPSYMDSFVKKVGFHLIGSAKFERYRMISILRRVGVTSTVGSSRVDFSTSYNVPIVVSGNDGYGNMSSEQLIVTYEGAKKVFGIHWSDMVNALLSAKAGSVGMKIYDNFVSIETEDSLGFLPMLM